METIPGMLTISYDPRKEVYTLRFGPAPAADAHGSAHHACQPDGRSCGKVRVNLTEAVQFLEKAGKPEPAALLRYDIRGHGVGDDRQVLPALGRPVRRQGGVAAPRWRREDTPKDLRPKPQVGWQK